jgi:hypothetical protein
MPTTIKEVTLPKIGAVVVTMCHGQLVKAIVIDVGKTKQGA